MPLKKPRRSRTHPSYKPMPRASRVRKSISADVHTSFDRFRQGVDRLHNRIESGANSVKSHLTTETCQRWRLRSSFKRAFSNLDCSPQSSPNQDVGNSRFTCVRQRAKSLVRNFFTQTRIYESEKYIFTDSSCSSSLLPHTNPCDSTVDLPIPLRTTPDVRIAQSPPPPPAKPQLTPINRRALRTAIRRAPDLRKTRRRPPHGCFMPRVVPRLVRGDSENWSVPGSGDDDEQEERGGWVGENHRGYVQFFVEPDLESIREELEELQGVERAGVWWWEENEG